MSLIKNLIAQCRMIKQSFQYVLIVPEYKGVHYAWNMYEIDQWIAQYENVDYIIYAPYYDQPINGRKMDGLAFINGL